MPGEVLLALAQFAGQTVAAAAITDVWESARTRFARLLGRGDARKTQVVEGWLAQTQGQLEAAAPGAVEQVRESAAGRWTDRFSDFLDEDPSMEAALRALVDEIAAQLPAGAVSASGHSVAAGRDIRITASSGGMAAGIIHGNVIPANPGPGADAGPGPQKPYQAGFGPAVAGPGGFSQGAGSIAATTSGLAIGSFEYQRRPDTAGLPVRLAPRPVVLAGRDRLLADLGVQLAPDPAQAGPRVAVLCGLGGAGKTSVAVEYAHRQLGEVGVCWQFAAEDPAVLASEFGVLAAQLGARDLVDARDPVAAVHAVLARSRTGWLVVFDNVLDFESVKAFLPPAGPGRVLITSQSQHWPVGWPVEVPALDPAVAAQFLVARTGVADQDVALQLATELGGLPLALEQAAAYMQATGILPTQYLELYRARQADLLARGEVAGHRGHVAATLGLALTRLTQDAPEAAGLMRLLAFLAPEPVPLGLLLAGQASEAALPPALRPLVGDPLAAADAVAALRRYSLVTPAGDGLIQVHRLVQAVTRAQLTSREADHWQQAAATVVEAAIPADGEPPSAWPTCAALLPHARAVLELTSFGLWQVARALGHSGSYATARDLFSLIAKAHLDSAEFGPEHPGTLNARHSLAIWTGEAGDVAAARDQLATLLTIHERILGPERRDTLIARGNLARWTGEAGDAASARDQFAALLPIHERILDPEHPHTLTTRANLARWTGRTGDTASARDQTAALLPISERIQGPDHPFTLNTRANLAHWTGEAGDPASARDQTAALLPISERIQGPEHPHTLNTRANLAHWTGKAGDPASARDQYAGLLPIRERIQGPEHPDTLITRRNLAYWTKKAGERSIGPG